MKKFKKKKKKNCVPIDTLNFIFKTVLVMLKVVSKAINMIQLVTHVFYNDFYHERSNQVIYFPN